MNKFIKWLNSRYMIVYWERRYFGDTTAVTNYYRTKRQALKDYKGLKKFDDIMAIRLLKRIKGKYERIDL